MTVVIVRLTAAGVGGLEVALLFVLGAWLFPADDDWIWGDLSRWLICAAVTLASMLFIGWRFPRGGGLMLAVLGGGVLIILGLSFTLRAGLLFGVPTLASGVLFMTAPRS